MGGGGGRMLPLGLDPWYWPRVFGPRECRGNGARRGEERGVGEREISRGLALWAPQGLLLPRHRTPPSPPRHRRSLPVCIRVLLLSPRCAHDRARTESRIERTYVRVYACMHVCERKSRFLLIVRRPYVPTIVRVSRSFKNLSDGDERLARI